MFNETLDPPVLTTCESPPVIANSPAEPFGEGLELDTKGVEQAADNGASGGANESGEPGGNEAELSDDMLGSLPPEIATLLVIAGIAGIPLPGPFGMPLLIAGGITLWPKTFSPIERWFRKRFPMAHREGVRQIKEFISNLEKRFPDTKIEK